LLRKSSYISICTLHRASNAGPKSFAIRDKTFPPLPFKERFFEELGIEIRIGAFIAESRFCYDSKNIRLLAYEAKHLDGDFE
jgi:hypothetical protein